MVGLRLHPCIGDITPPACELAVQILQVLEHAILKHLAGHPAAHPFVLFNW